MSFVFTIERQIEKGGYSGGIVIGRSFVNGVVVFEKKGVYIGEMKNGEIMHGIGRTLVFCDTALCEETSNIIGISFEWAIGKC
jgi:hypothetical protein